MDAKNDKVTVLFMLAVMAFAIVLVDDRWMRVGLGLLPALLLAQRALGGSGVGEDAAPRVGHTAERRGDESVRAHIDDLLKHFRDFYTMCHLMSGGQMDPEKAKERAAGIELRLNRLLAKITESAKDIRGES